MDTAYPRDLLVIIQVSQYIDYSSEFENSYFDRPEIIELRKKNEAVKLVEEPDIKEREAAFKRCVSHLVLNFVPYLSWLPRSRGRECQGRCRSYRKGQRHYECKSLQY